MEAQTCPFVHSPTTAFDHAAVRPRDEHWPTGATLRKEAPIVWSGTHGYGVHSSLGMRLAKMGLHLAIQEIVNRLPNYELVDESPDPQIWGGVIWGFPSFSIRPVS